MREAAYGLNREQRNYCRKIRRQRELRRKFILAGISLMLVLFFALSYHVLISQANTGMEDISYKYFTSVQIQAGDTLWSLADRYADEMHYASQEQYITEVMEINHLTDEAIYAGNYLIVPYYSAEFMK